MSYSSYKSNFKKSLDIIKIKNSLDEYSYTDKKNITEYISKIEDNLQSLKNSVNYDNLNNTLFSLTRLEFTLFEIYNELGISADKSFDIFYKSKLTTLCNSKNEAEETKKYYTFFDQNEGENAEFCIKNFENEKYAVYCKKTLEFYPSVYYSSPDFNSLTNTKDYKKLFDFI